MCWVLFPIKKYEKNNDQEFMLSLFLSRYFFLIATGIKIDEQTLKRRGKKKRCTWGQGHWSRHVQIKSSRQLTTLENNCLMLKLFIYDFDRIKELTQLGLIRT